MSDLATNPLPVDAIREKLLLALKTGPVVLTAPTGTGKSTQVPRWIGGRVLVVQPRRVACRAVAGRIAELEGLRLGERIGYRVRDDDCSGPSTEILVVTPGIVLGSPALLEDCDLVILDEFHERRLDTDLILALLIQKRAAFMMMSATMEAERVAQHVGGVHLEVEARNYPVEQSYDSPGDELPEVQGLEGRVLRALKQRAPIEGDALVFVPGKAEVASVQEALGSQGWSVQVLHGGLTLEQQSRVLRASSERRVIVATNVAETSVTIPGVRLVIDSGLVRRTAYHGGRSYLTLTPIAEDSADQRAGRAGRTAPGECVRLWGARAQLNAVTPPEIHRESLVPLVMTTAALNLRAEDLSFLDAPKSYALLDARQRLVALGALEGAALGEEGEARDTLTERGLALVGLPLDPWLSRILVEAEQTGALQEAIDLVAALDQSTAYLFGSLVKEEELDVVGCDAAVLVTAVRRTRAPSSALGSALREARFRACRLRQAFRQPALIEDGSGFAINESERERLIRTLLKADPACAHVARRRKNSLVFAGGGAELTLARESRVNRLLESAENGGKQVEAVVVLGSRAFFKGRERRLLATFASQVPLKWLSEAGLGETRVAGAAFDRKDMRTRRLVSTVERLLAGKVIDSWDEEPTGELARQAIVQLFLSGRLYPKAFKQAQRHLSRRALAFRLGERSEASFFKNFPRPPALQEWISAQLEEWGLESGEDLALLSENDFVPEDVPAELAPQLDDQYPAEVDLGDCLYEVAYDLEKKQVTLSIVRGARKTPPPASYLPKFSGFRVFVEAGGSFHPLRR